MLRHTNFYINFFIIIIKLQLLLALFPHFTIFQYIFGVQQWLQH